MAPQMSTQKLEAHGTETFRPRHFASARLGPAACLDICFVSGGGFASLPTFPCAWAHVQTSHSRHQEEGGTCDPSPGEAWSYPILKLETGSGDIPRPSYSGGANHEPRVTNRQLDLSA